MIFENPSDEFLNYQLSLDSPDLRPISLPMSGNDKMLDGMINLQNAAISFPDSNVFTQYAQPSYMPRMPGQYAFTGSYQDGELDYYSDSELGYSGDFDAKSMVPLDMIDHAGHNMVNRAVEPLPASHKRKASASPEYAQPQPQKKPVLAQSHVQDFEGGQYDLNQPAPYSPYLVTPIGPNVVTRPIKALPKSHKRKASGSPEYVQPQPQKKSVVTQVHVQDPEGEYYDLNQQSPYSPYVVAPANHTANNSPRPSHNYSASNASQVSLAAPSPHTPAWSPSFTTVKTEHSPRAPMTPIPRPASTCTPYSASVPKLVRTSTIPQQSSPVVTMNVGVHTHAFNPYAMYPQHKASLRLKGDLDAVAMEWSDEELDARRKLIVFTRCQNGSVIDAEFKTVPQDAWQRGDITVNCIWWKEREEAFVTSVDTIALLEQLVAVRFTVEEKNRIRRNLEGFRPLTVSKAKSDSEDFFKVIMGFPNPKPRNIEKDVKVFPWKILAHALKKIISKYSASYSSTASTLITPANSVYASTEHSADYQLTQSPGNEIMPHSMPPQTVPIATPYDHHLVQGRMSAPVTSSVSELSVHVPSMPPAYEMTQPYGYDMTPMASYPMAMPQHAVSAPIHHQPPNWHFDGYTTAEGVMHMQPASAPTTAYPRGHPVAADFIIPAVYQPNYPH